MLSTLDSLSSSPGSTPGWGHCVKSWEMHFTLTVPLSTLVYKLIPANLMPGLNLRYTSIPSREE